MQLNAAVASLEALKLYVSSKRDRFEEYFKLGVELTDTEHYKEERTRQRSVRLDPLDYGSEPEVSFSSTESYRINQFFPIIDTFITSLNQRILAYEEVELRFGFLSRFDILTEDELTKHAKILTNFYETDLDETLEGELSRFQKYCSSELNFDPEKSKISREQAMYSLLIDKDAGIRESFPNVEIVLRLYLTLIISNCSGERAFSKLNLIQCASRTSMTQIRLNCLTIIASEKDVLKEIPVDEIIDRFAAEKARKVFI